MFLFWKKKKSVIKQITCKEHVEVRTPDCFWILDRLHASYLVKTQSIWYCSPYHKLLLGTSMEAYQRRQFSSIIPRSLGLSHWSKLTAACVLTMAGKALPLITLWNLETSWFSNTIEILCLKWKYSVVKLDARRENKIINQRKKHPLVLASESIRKQASWKLKSPAVSCSSSFFHFLFCVRWICMILKESCMLFYRLI